MNFAADGTEFVHFDEFEDAVVAIELVGSQSVDVQTRPSQWKWIVLAMQNALQGAMVIALSGTDGCGALAPKSQKENRAWLQHLSPSVRDDLWPTTTSYLNGSGNLNWWRDRCPICQRKIT